MEDQRSLEQKVATLISDVAELKAAGKVAGPVGEPGPKGDQGEQREHGENGATSAEEHK